MIFHHIPHCTVGVGGPLAQVTAARPEPNPPTPAAAPVSFIGSPGSGPHHSRVRWHLGRSRHHATALGRGGMITPGFFQTAQTIDEDVVHGFYEEGMRSNGG